MMLNVNIEQVMKDKKAVIALLQALSSTVAFTQNQNDQTYGQMFLLCQKATSALLRQPYTNVIDVEATVIDEATSTTTTTTDTTTASVN